MKYVKPAVIDLRSRAAAGQDPLACMAGDTVSPIDCFAGSNDTACYAGTGGYAFPQDCLNGTGAPGGSCLPGVGATTYECAGGSSPLYPGTCTVGPSA